MICGDNCDAGPLGPSLAELCQAPQFFIFMTLVNELILSNEKISGRCERVTPIDDPDDVYDFVVIGGGGSGSPVASRLSENPRCKILLLEAGHDEPAGGQIPMSMVNLLYTSIDWNFTTSNEAHACLSRNGSCPLSSGKMLGGSTSHNGMVYMRGVPGDYDHWRVLGNKGWAWKDVLPYFLRSEDNGEIERVGTKHHATGGPLRVERYPYMPPFGSSILAAAREVGFGISEDLNGDQMTGFSILQATNDHGVRCSSSRAYLWPARDRENLDVSLNSYVTKVLIDNDTAVGVEYFKDGKLKTVHVSREVILSAGALKSPQILLLSGIGSKQHLKSMGIKVVKDLPGVGKNYHDHTAYVANFVIDEPDTYDNNYQHAMEYATSQTGPLSAFGLVQIGGRFNTPLATPGIPDIQLTFRGYSSICAPGEVGALQSNGKRGIDIEVMHNDPWSRGQITLATKNPFQDPMIHGNYLSDPHDVEALVNGIEMALKLTNAQALQAHNMTLSAPPDPACSKYNFASRKYWACVVKQDRAPNNHAAGSCKMGPSSDSMAVVDHRLRVYGIKKLRVADVSIMPKLPSGNTAAPAMMIGERAADFIKEDWKL